MLNQLKNQHMLVFAVLCLLLGAVLLFIHRQRSASPPLPPEPVAKALGLPKTNPSGRIPVEGPSQGGFNKQEVHVNSLPVSLQPSQLPPSLPAASQLPSETEQAKAWLQQEEERVENLTAGMDAFTAAKFLYELNGGREGHYTPYIRELTVQALAENPNDFDTILLWTRLQPYQSYAHNPEREAGYRKLLEMEPTSLAALVGLGESIYWVQPEEAVQHLEKAKLKDPGLANAYLAFAYQRLGDYDKALDILKERPENDIVAQAHLLGIESGEPYIPPIQRTEAAQLLEHLKTEVAAYNTQFKSGEIEFSLTLSRKLPQRRNFWDSLLKLLQSPKVDTVENVPSYEDRGYWYITHRFDGEYQFYDVKARKKEELNGRPTQTWIEDGVSSDIWQETHHQYLRKGQRLFIRDGTEWKQDPSPNIPYSLFDKRFNPRWWSWPPHGEPFEKFIHSSKPVEVETVELEGTPYYYLKLYHEAEKENAETATTHEIWMHPQKAYHATRMLTCNRITSLFPVEGNIWPLSQPSVQPIEVLHLSSQTYQLAIYEPGIWFPKTVIAEAFGYHDMDSIFPDTLASEYPVMVNEALLPESFREEHLTWPRRKITLQVHRAVFNIPIAKKELGIGARHNNLDKW